MHPKTRRAALHAIAVVAILASLNALAHSYAGLYQWALHHRMTGWQAVTWPAEIDVFLVVGELALYVAYLDAWSARHKLWPWTTALAGLAVSVAGNIGHIHASPGTAVPLVDRLTAATSPLAAFAGLAIALLVLKQTRTSARAVTRSPAWRPMALSDASVRISTQRAITPTHPRVGTERVPSDGGHAAPTSANLDESCILSDARAVQTEYECYGVQLSRRRLARELRARGHTIANARLSELAAAIGLP